MYLCSGCNEYKSSRDFALKTTTSVVGLCRRCTQLDNEGRRREDFCLYKNILKHLRETEAECSPESEITYLLQVQGNSRNVNQSSLISFNEHLLYLY